MSSTETWKKTKRSDGQAAYEISAVQVVRRVGLDGLQEEKSSLEDEIKGLQDQVTRIEADIAKIKKLERG